MKLWLVLMLAAGAAQAQTPNVWRCADGYRDTPCSEGRAVTASDRRDAADMRAAHAVAKHDQALADRMARERRLADKPTSSGLAGIKPLPPSSPASAVKPQKKPKRDAARGTSPTAPRASRPAPG